jgi:hypothetical protein
MGVSEERDINENILVHSRVLLGKLIVAQFVKKYPAAYLTGGFSTLFTRAH